MIPRETCYDLTFALLLSQKATPVNFQKAVVIAVAVALAIGAWMYFSRVDRANPQAVATAFTKALKSKSTSKASSYYVPAEAKAWQTSADSNIENMKSGATDRFWDGIPSSPTFKAPSSAAGITSIRTDDESFSLEMKQIDGKWYVSKGPV